jgi:hypothetical protein
MRYWLRLGGLFGGEGALEIWWGYRLWLFKYMFTKLISGSGSGWNCETAPFIAKMYFGVLAP